MILKREQDFKKVQDFQKTALVEDLQSNRFGASFSLAASVPRITMKRRSLPTCISSLLIALLYIVVGFCRAEASDKNEDPPVIPKKQIDIDVHGFPVLVPLVGAGTW